MGFELMILREQIAHFFKYGRISLDLGKKRANMIYVKGGKECC